MNGIESIDSRSMLDRRGVHGETIEKS